MAFIGTMNLTGSLIVTAYSQGDRVVWFPACRRHGALESEPVTNLETIRPCPICDPHDESVKPAA
jgi:hypothetical protein